MKKWMIPVLCILMLLSGCVRPSAQPQQTDEPTVSTATESSASPTVPMEGTLPESVVTPGEMPSAPEADAEIPPQPQPPLVSE